MQLPKNDTWLVTRQNMRKEIENKAIITKQIHGRLQNLETMMLERKYLQTPMVQRIDTPTNECINETLILTINNALSNSNIDFDRFKNVPNGGSIKIIKTGMLYRNGPSLGSGKDSENSVGSVYQLGVWSPGGGGQGNGGGDGDPGNVVTTMVTNENGYQKYGREFILANLRNIIVPTFSGTNLSAKPYIPFNKVMRKLIRALGEDGETLLDILNEIKTYGDVSFDNDKLNSPIT